MISSGFLNAFQNLKEISKSCVQKHKEMLMTFRNIEFKSKSSVGHDNQKPILIDHSTLESLLRNCSQLIDLDEKSYSNLIFLKEYSLKFDLIVKKVQGIKFQQDLINKCIFQDLKSFKYFLSDLCSGYTKQAQAKLVSEESIKKNLKIVLKTLVYPETIDLYSLQREMDVPVRLLNSYYKNFVSEEPELELNSKNEKKKLVNHAEFLTKSLEKVSESLLKLFSYLLPKREIKPPEDTFGSQSLTANELKILMLKINKLHNRGSLTDEEARNMLGKISELPVIPCDESLELDIKNSNDETEVLIEDCIIHEKASSPFAKSFTKEFHKRPIPFRKTTKRVQTPNKRILRNTSLPRASALIKFNSRDKPKQLKIKSKSPHSFLYI